MKKLVAILCAVLISVPAWSMSYDEAESLWETRGENITNAFSASKMYGSLANTEEAGKSVGWRNDSIKEATVKAALSWRDGDGIISTGDTWRSESTSDNYVKPIILT